MLGFNNAHKIKVTNGTESVALSEETNGKEIYKDSPQRTVQQLSTSPLWFQSCTLSIFQSPARYHMGRIKTEQTDTTIHSAQHLSRVRRANGANLDVGEDNLGRGRLRLDGGRLARVSAASTTGNTRVSSSGIGRVGAVEPEHIGVVVVPQAHHQNHALCQSITHTGETTVLGEDVLVTKGSLLGSAEVRGDRVAGNTTNIRGRVGNHIAILHVDTLNLLEGTGSSAVTGDELSDNSHLGAAVDGLAGSEEGLVAHAVRVEVATIGVAGAGVAVRGVRATAPVSLAHSLTGGITRVGGQSSGDTVSLPDIHLSTAGAVVANTRVGVV